ncbi:TetR/AcrR family transcriptional regulator [bacterium]|nr:TetR/AcrR family transcriptional regulator [bacterium]
MTGRRSAKREPRTGARERVLQAACHYIELQGFQEASLNDILSMAGVSPSNFYYHWKSKDDLGLSVVRQLTEGLEERIVRGILEDASRSPLGRIRAWVEETRKKLAEHGCTRGCPFGRLSSELSESHPMFRKELERAFTLLRSAVEACVREGQEQGEIRSEVEPAHASSLLIAAVQGLLLLEKSEKNVSVYANGSGELIRCLAVATISRGRARARRT